MPPWAIFTLPYLALISAVWLTYWDTLSYGATPATFSPWVSDDLHGISIYRGDWKDPDPFKPPEQWVKGPLSFHRVLRHLRWLAGRLPNSNKAWKRDQQLPYLPFAPFHHRLNLWLFCGISGLLYTFLQQFISPTLAFSAVLLWIVHPLGCQTVGWISGIGYVLSTFLMLVGLNFILLAQQLGWTTSPLGMTLCLLVFTGWQWLAVECWFGTVGMTVILAFLHLWSFAILSGLISVYGCANTLREALGLRRKTFQDQQMGQSTKFYPRKFIVVLKTLCYNTFLAVWPKRLSLYHTFYYHYELPYAEQEDRYFFGGLLLCLLCGIGLWLGSWTIRLGILWVLSFLFLFLNWITANQFVVDRYVWLPSFGLCLIAASLLPPLVTAGLTGTALMRTWSHLPTYENEEKFYLSNIWNFGRSEAAYGNLGVIYLNHGYVPEALGAWFRGIQINPQYDVTWYNISTCLRHRGPLNPNYFPLFFNILPKPVLEQALVRDPARGHLHVARYCLEQAVASTTCHFPKPWQQELLNLTQELSHPAGVPPPSVSLVQPLLTAALT